MGKLIVFEGVDGIGKSALAKVLTNRLSQAGIPNQLVAFPGNAPNSLGSLVYRIHHDTMSLGLKSVSELALQAMHIAAHLDILDETIIPSLEQGNCIILDRFWWSTWAYGIARGISSGQIEPLIEAERRRWGDWKPSTLFLIDGPKPFRTEHVPEMYLRLRGLYHELVAREQGEYRIVPVQNENFSAACQTIWDSIDSLHLQPDSH